MKQFSVIGYYADNMQPFIWHVQARSVKGAVQDAYHQICESNSYEVDPDNVMLVDVVAGHVKGAIDTNNVTSFAEFV